MSVLTERADRPDLTDDVRQHPGRRMTEEEFVDWCGEKTRAEWVDGEIVMMAPVSDAHDSLQGWLVSVLRSFVEERELGEVRGPEFMVRLGSPRRRRLPDVLFVAKARLSIIKPSCLEGAPDLVVEIVSPDSEVRDLREKYEDYEQAGVREYWIIDPATARVVAYAVGKDRRYRPIEEAAGKIASGVVSGFYLRPQWISGSRLPKPLAVLRELGVVS